MKRLKLQLIARIEAIVIHDDLKRAIVEKIRKCPNTTYLIKWCRETFPEFFPESAFA